MPNFNSNISGITAGVLALVKTAPPQKTAPNEGTQDPEINRYPSDKSASLNALVAAAGVRFGATQPSSSPVSTKNDDYPNLTPQDEQLIDEKLSSIDHYPYDGFSREDLKKLIEKDLNEAKGTVESLLGHSVSLNDKEIKTAIDNIVINAKDPARISLDVQQILQDNINLSPEEEKYLDTQQRPYYPPFWMPQDQYGTANGILKNLVGLVDAKTGGHMSDADIDRLWGIMQNYVNANPNVVQDFLDCGWNGAHQDGINFTVQDYQNILAQYFASSGT